jgi:hypothetical protein
MIPDVDMLEQRLKAMQDLPWPVPANVVMQITDEEWDHLAVAGDTLEYWSTLNGIVRRIREDA